MSSLAGPPRRPGRHPAPRPPARDGPALADPPSPEPPPVSHSAQCQPAPGPPPRRRALKRADIYRGTLRDGRVVPDNLWTRLGRMTSEALTSKREREEAALDARLRRRPSLTRPNVVAVLSPKGGVGKTSCTALAGNLLASHPRLNTLAIDANPDHGSLGKLAADSTRSGASLADVLARMDRIHSPADLFPFVSVCPAGLHILAAPQRAEVMQELVQNTHLYGRLVHFLRRFYDVILLDLGTGLASPLALFTLERADQGLIVTTPHWTTSATVLDAVPQLRRQFADNHLGLVINKAATSRRGDTAAIEQQFRHHGVRRYVAIPYSHQLHTMLDTGTYALEGLPRQVRVPIKQLGLALAEQLV